MPEGDRREDAQLLLIAGVMVALMLTLAYAFLAGLGESVAPAGGSARCFAAANAMDVAERVAAWNAEHWNASLAWDARANLSAGLWAADAAGFGEENALLLAVGMALWAWPNSTLSGLEAGRFRLAHPGVECDAVGPFVLYNATLYTPGGVPYNACCVHATCLDLHVQGDGLHLWRSEAVVGA